MFLLIRLSSSAKALLAGISGTALQWYDFALFGYFAPIIAATYFPNQSRLASLLFTFSVLTVGYLLAPLGALVFGYIGDRHGRKKALSLSILSMAIPTALIGLLPGYEQIGISAALLLSLLRIIQGFVASAEYTGSTIFLVEHAKAEQKALYGCLSSAAYNLGLILAGLSASFFTASFMPSWAWRLGFGMALLGGILIFFLRTQVKETPEYQEIKTEDKPKNPALTALKEVPFAFFGVIGISWFVGILTFGTYVFLATYLNLYFQIPLTLVSLMISFGLMIDALLEPFIALLAQRLGLIRIIRFGMIGVLGCSLPLFHLFTMHSIGLSAFSIAAFSVLIAFTCAPLNAYMISLFPKQYRYSGYGLSFHIGISIFGALTPLILLGLIENTHSYLCPAYYYVLGALIGLSSLSLCEKSRKKSLRSQGAKQLSFGTQKEPSKHSNSSLI